MKNIFENAYFGKPYQRRDGKKALYHIYDTEHNKHFLFKERSSFHYDVNPDGSVVSYECPNDIVSEWNDEINEEELEKLALEYFNKQWCTSYKSLEEITDDLDQQAIEDFKAGYRKAKGE